MTRTELVTRLARRFPEYYHADVDASIKLILTGFAKALVAGRRIEIRGFGTLFLAYRPPRRGRNPKTGTPVDVPGLHIPHFRSGRILQELLNPAKGI